MAQPTMTMRNRGIRVVSGLLVCMGLLLMLLPGAGVSPPAQAQEPDVSASAITQNVSANVSISHYPAVSGTQTFTYSRNVNPSVTVRVRCWGAFYINVAVSLSGNVPLTVVYIPGGRTESKNMLMSGSKTQSFYASVCVSGYPYIVAPTVPVTGSVTVTAQPGESGAAITGNGTLYGTATIWVTGNAQLITYAYLPLIARQVQPEGVYWSDDFSSNKGWINYKCTDPANNLVDCDCTMELKDGRLRVTLDDENMRCFVAPPSSVQLREGVFSVEARKRNTNKTWYGLLFNVSTQLHKQRWALEARPYGGSGCASDKGLVWLSYITDGPGTGDLWDTCTDTLKLGDDEWNKLTAIRRGDNVKVFINDQGPKIEQNEDALKDQPFFNLEVMSENETPVEVEFDNFVLQY